MEFVIFRASDEDRIPVEAPAPGAFRRQWKEQRSYGFDTLEAWFVDVPSLEDLYDPEEGLIAQEGSLELRVEAGIPAIFIDDWDHEGDELDRIAIAPQLRERKARVPARGVHTVQVQRIAQPVRP